MPAAEKKRLAKRSSRRDQAKPASTEIRTSFIEPMKALGVTAVPAGEWLLELKFDGYRAVAVITKDRVRLWSRNRNDLSEDYPEVVAALQKRKFKTAVIDGEIVALDPTGRPRFQLLQNRDRSSGKAPLVYYVFDVLQCDGRSLMELPLEERQRELRKLFGADGKGVVRVSPVFEVEPTALLAEVRKQGLEGIVAKRAGSRYEPGMRSGAWMKCKVSVEQEFVIGGFTPPQNSRPHFGAILVGYYEGRNFIYAGKVGSGFDHAKLASLHERFVALKITTSPFGNLPLEKRSRFGSGMTPSVMKTVTWVRPKLVCQVRFSEWTADGLLRQPVFLGLRNDKPAKDVRREAGAASVAT